MGGMSDYLIEIAEQDNTCFYLEELKNQPDRVKGLVKAEIRDLGVCAFCGNAPPESPIVHMGPPEAILLCEECHKELHTELDGVDELWSLSASELYG